MERSTAHVDLLVGRELLAQALGPAADDGERVLEVVGDDAGEGDQLVALLVLAGDVAQRVDHDRPRVAVEAVDRDRGDLEGPLLAGRGAGPGRSPGSRSRRCGRACAACRRAASGSPASATITGCPGRCRRAAGSRRSPVIRWAAGLRTAYTSSAVITLTPSARCSITAEKRAARESASRSADSARSHRGAPLLGAEGDRERREDLGDRGSPGRSRRGSSGPARPGTRPARSRVATTANDPEHEGEQHGRERRQPEGGPDGAEDEGEGERRAGRARTPPTPAAWCRASIAERLDEPQHRAARPTRARTTRAARLHAGRGAGRAGPRAPSAEDPAEVADRGEPARSSRCSGGIRPRPVPRSTATRAARSRTLAARKRGQVARAGSAAASPPAPQTPGASRRMIATQAPRRHHGEQDGDDDLAGRAAVDEERGGGRERPGRARPRARLRRSPVASQSTATP